MREHIVIVDNLYDIPHQYHKGFFENQCVITGETVSKIAEVIGNPIKIISATNEVGGDSDVVAHLESDWIVVIYLTLPMQSFGETGIKFYSHLATGLEAFPTSEEMNKYQITNNNLLEVFNSDLSIWKEYANILAKYNRMVLFRSDLWHSYSTNLNNSILFQKIIIKND
jgi:hypothetical protein